MNYIAGMADSAVLSAELAEVTRRLAEAYEPERIYLFGSHARGEAGPDSDYDLLVVVPDDAPKERRRSRLAYEVLRGTGTAADVLVCTHSYFEDRRTLKASLPLLSCGKGASSMALDPRAVDVQAWLRKAELDLRAAAHDLTDPDGALTADAVFHAQQASSSPLVSSAHPRL